MNVIAYAHGKIIFSPNLYYNNRATEFFNIPSLICPMGLLLPMGPPMVQLKEWAFNPTLLPDESCLGMNTAMLVEPNGRICHIEFCSNDEKGVKLFRQYYDTDRDAHWAVCDQHSASITMSGLIELTKSPKQALELLAQVETIVLPGYEEWVFEDLVKFVVKAMAVLKRTRDKFDKATAEGASK